MNATFVRVLLLRGRKPVRAALVLCASSNHRCLHSCHCACACHASMHLPVMLASTVTAHCTYQDMSSLSMRPKAGTAQSCILALIHSFYEHHLDCKMRVLSCLEKQRLTSISFWMGWTCPAMDLPCWHLTLNLRWCLSESCH